MEESIIPEQAHLVQALRFELGKVEGPADGDPKQFQPKRAATSVEQSGALSMVLAPKRGIQTRKVAILAADGVDEAAIVGMKAAMTLPGSHKSLDKRGDVPGDAGIVAARQASAKHIAARFIKAMEPHRHWAREIELASPE